jgi:hypothetical protein
MPTVSLSPDALVRIEGGEVVTWAECERRLLAARTPAPEGEAWLWGCADGNGIDPRLVFRDRPTAEQVAADTNMVVQPLYASPVVPVGVRERVLDELDKAWLHGQRRTSWRRDESADAILAALCPTDTGGE